MPRHTTKSLRIITIPRSINAQKKTVLTQPSTTANFSSFTRKSFWRMRARNLPPSKAGIGKTLKIARAIDSIPPKPRKIRNQNSSRSFPPNFTAPTGPVSCFKASLVFPASKEKSFFPIVPRADIVRFHSAFISFSPASIAPPSQNFTGKSSKSPDWA